MFYISLKVILKTRLAKFDHSEGLTTHYMYINVTSMNIIYPVVNCTIVSTQTITCEG